MPCKGAFSAALEEEGIEFEIKPLANGGYTVRSAGFWLFPFKWRAMQRHLADWADEIQTAGFEVVYSNSSVVAAGALLAERTGLPHVWHLREYGWADYGIYYLWGKRVFTQHLKAAAAVVCISKSIRTHYFGQNEAAAAVVLNGVGTRATLAQRANDAMPNGKDTNSKAAHKAPFTFLIIGLLHPSKNQIEAVRAFGILTKKLREGVRLEIVGKGRVVYTFRLRCYIWWYGLGKAVQMRGFVANPDATYRAADAVLMCSRNEAMGRVTAEAMAYRKPVVGFASGATPEIITDEQTGLLYDNTHHTAAKNLAAAMYRIATDAPLRERLATNATAWVLENCADETYVAKIWEIIQAVRTKQP